MHEMFLTPGSFEFDIWVPPEYPAVPPKCKLVTTGRGRVRFNANLYQNGKVCLSLLGTWQGPGWDPKQSNLLQVVESLAFNIMIGEPVSGHPWFNEPGYSEADCPDGTDASLTPLGKACSKEYNRQVRRCTMQHAMIDMLQTPPKAFVDVIKAHYRAASPMVRQLVDKWALEEGCTSGEAAKLRALATNAKHSLCSLQSVLLLAWHALCKHASSLASALAPPGNTETSEAAAENAPLESGTPTTEASSNDSFSVGVVSIPGTAALPQALAASLKVIDDFTTEKSSNANPLHRMGHSLVGQTVEFVNLDAKPELNGQHGKCLQWLPARGRYVVELLSGSTPNQSSTSSSNTGAGASSGDGDSTHFFRVRPENLQLPADAAAATTGAAEENERDEQTSGDHRSAAEVASASTSSDTPVTVFESRRQTCYGIFTAYLQIAKQQKRKGAASEDSRGLSESSGSSSSATTLQSWPTQSEQWSSGAVNAAAEAAAMCSVVQELQEQLSALEVQEAKTNEAQAKALGDKLATLQQTLGAAASEKQGSDGNAKNSTVKSDDSAIQSDTTDVATTTVTTAAGNHADDPDDSATSVRVLGLKETLEAMGMAESLCDEELLRALVLHHPMGQASYDEMLMVMLDEHFNPGEWRQKLAPPAPPSQAVAAATVGSGESDGNGVDKNDSGGENKATVVSNPTVDEWVCFCTHANSCAMNERCIVCGTDRIPTFTVRKRLATAAEAAQVLAHEKAKLEAASASAAELLRLLKLRDEDPGAVVWEYAQNTPHPHHHHHDMGALGDQSRWQHLSAGSSARIERAWSQETTNAARSADAEKAWLQSVTTAAAAPAATTANAVSSAPVPAEDATATSSQDGNSAAKAAAGGAASTMAAGAASEAAQAVLTAAPGAKTEVPRKHIERKIE